MRVPVIDMQATGKKIKELRYKKGIKVKDIVEYMGISENSVMKWQRGESLPTTDNFLMLQYIFDTSMLEILQWSMIGEDESPLLPFLKVFCRV